MPTFDPAKFLRVGRRLHRASDTLGLEDHVVRQAHRHHRQDEVPETFSTALTPTRGWTDRPDISRGKALALQDLVDGKPTQRGGHTLGPTNS